MAPSSLSQYWERIDSLLDAAGDEEVKRVLQYGTPEQKRSLLKQFDLDHADLVFIHKELEKIVYQGSLRFWWW